MSVYSYKSKTLIMLHLRFISYITASHHIFYFPIRKHLYQRSINTRLYGMKTVRRNLLSKISVSVAPFRAVSSGAKSLELQLAQVSQRMKGVSVAYEPVPVLAQEVQIRLWLKGTN